MRTFCVKSTFASHILRMKKNSSVEHVNESQPLNQPSTSLSDGPSTFLTENESGTSFHSFDEHSFDSSQ